MFIKRKDLLFFLTFIGGMTAVVWHLFFGYAFPTSACLVMALAYVVTYTMKDKLLAVAWLLSVLVTYIVVDSTLYNPDGISKLVYSYCMMLLFVAIFTLILFTFCVTKSLQAVRSKHMSACRKVARLKAVLSLYGFYVVPTCITVVITGVVSTVNSDNMTKSQYLFSSTVIFVVIVFQHFAIWLSTKLFTRAVVSNCEDSELTNEV